MGCQQTRQLETGNNSKREALQNAKRNDYTIELGTLDVVGQATHTVPSHKVVPSWGGCMNDVQRAASDVHVALSFLFLQIILFPLLLRFVPLS